MWIFSRNSVILNTDNFTEIGTDGYHVYGRRTDGTRNIISSNADDYLSIVTAIRNNENFVEVN